MKIQIKPIEIERWHNKKGNESFKRPINLPALVDTSSMTYTTGLDNIIEKYKDPDNPEKLLTEQAYYSKLLKVDLSNQFNIDTPHPFWDSKMAQIKLENRTQFLDTKNPLEYVKIKILKASKYVANSMKEYEEGLFPEATHVIFDESEEIEEKASKVSLRNTAIIESAKLSKEQKISLIMVLSSDNGDYIRAKNLKGKSDNFIEVELSSLIEKKPEEFLRNLKMDKKDIYTKAIVLECLQKSVLHKEGHKIMYHESVLGQDVNDVVEYLNLSENQEFKLRLISQVND